MARLKQFLVQAIATSRDRLFDSRPEGEGAKLLVGVLLLLCGAYSLIYFAVTAHRAMSQPIGDFFGLWSAGKFLLDHPAAEIYDAATLKAAQLALGMDPGIDYPFPYPPSFMLVVAPLGLLPWPVAYLLLIGVTLPLFIWATAGRCWRSWIGLGALVAPATTITIIAGQAGLLAAALMAGGFRLAARRPILAGVLLGLLTYKPQMGVLVPVAQLAQAVAAIAAVALVWDCFRRGATPLAGAALMTATFLATPHAFVYDMPIVTTAVLWTIIEGQRSGQPFGLGERLILMLAFTAPITLPPTGIRFPVAVLSLILLLGLISRRCRRLHPVPAGGWLPAWLGFRAPQSL